MLKVKSSASTGYGLSVRLCVSGVSALQVMLVSTVSWTIMTVKKTSVRTEASASMLSTDTPVSVLRDTGKGLKNKSDSEQVLLFKMSSQVKFVCLLSVM